MMSIEAIIDQAIRPVRINIADLSGHGGWPLCRFEKVVADELRCKLCQNVCQDAMALNCGHSFCKTCIFSSDSNFKNQCPTCNKCMTQTVPDFSTRMKINGLMITCRYRSLECDHVDAVSRIEAHEVFCTFKPIQCLLCQDFICKNKMTHHVNHDCLYRMQMCNLCDLSIPFCDMENHTRLTCTTLKKTCMYCDWIGTIGTHPVHDTECEHKPVPCTYMSYGCMDYIPRYKLAHHEQDSLHMPLLFRALKQMEHYCYLSRPEVPIRVASHRHLVILCADLVEPCAFCKMPLSLEKGRTFAYRCTQGCDYHLCANCVIKERIYKLKENVTVPSFLSTFLQS